MRNVGDNGESNSTSHVRSWKARGTKYGEDIQFNFQNSTGSKYKHKGFIIGIPPLRAEANSLS